MDVTHLPNKKVPKSLSECTNIWYTKKTITKVNKILQAQIWIQKETLFSHKQYPLFTLQVVPIYDWRQKLEHTLKLKSLLGSKSRGVIHNLKNNQHEKHQ